MFAQATAAQEAIDLDNLPGFITFNAKDVHESLLFSHRWRAMLRVLALYSPFDRVQDIQDEFSVVRRSYTSDTAWICDNGYSSTMKNTDLAQRAKTVMRCACHRTPDHEQSAVEVQ